jgi:choline-phosphate cytidylyltransferase
MMRSRQTNRDSQHESDSSEEESYDRRSPPRGRTGKTESATKAQEEQTDAQIKAMMDENSKESGA